MPWSIYIYGTHSHPLQLAVRVCHDQFTYSGLILFLCSLQWEYTMIILHIQDSFSSSAAWREIYNEQVTYPGLILFLCSLQWEYTTISLQLQDSFSSSAACSESIPWSVYIFRTHSLPLQPAVRVYDDQFTYLHIQASFSLSAWTRVGSFSSVIDIL
jgi:hypothetical protein